MYELYSGTPISLGAKIQKNFVCYAKGYVILRSGWYNPSPLTITGAKNVFVFGFTS